MAEGRGVEPRRHAWRASPGLKSGPATGPDALPPRSLKLPERQCHQPKRSDQQRHRVRDTDPVSGCRDITDRRR